MRSVHFDKTPEEPTEKKSVAYRLCLETEDFQQEQDSGSLE